MEQLYTSSDPNFVHLLQRDLQLIQRSPEGVRLASSLLQQPSRNCKYFGALTFTVAIQNSDLQAEKLHEMINVVSFHMAALIASPDTAASNMFIVKKLMSNLSLLYVKYSEMFRNPMWHFLSLIGGSQHNVDFAHEIAQLSSFQLDLLLTFASVLIEDILKLNDYRSAVHDLIRTEVLPLLIVLYQYLIHLFKIYQLPGGLDLRALETLNAWMTYFPNVSGDSRYTSEDMVTFVEFIYLHFEKLVDPEDAEGVERFAKCFLTLNEILEINPALLDFQNKQSLYAILLEQGNWGVNFMERIIFSDYIHEFQEEVVAFVDLLLTILQLNSIKLSKSILEPATHNILAIALGMTAVKGIPFVDETISERLLVFWEDFANVFEDSDDVFATLFENNDDPNIKQEFESAKRKIFNEVAQIYWKKLHIPDLSTYNSIRTEFNSYRIAVADFFLVAYSLLKTDFYEMMTRSLVEGIQNIGDGTIRDIEATLFLLYKINDDSVYFESQAQALAPSSDAIFLTNLIEQVKSLSLDDPTNMIFFSTFVQFLSSNEFYFKTPTGSRHLGGVFETIFPIIMASNSNLSLLASKTAAKLCEECSVHLLTFLPVLKNVVIEMLNNTSIDSLIRLRMFNAYSAIAKSVDNVQDHSKIIHEMVSAIAEAGNVMTNRHTNSLLELDEEYLVSLLSCLVNISNGSALSDDSIDEMLDERKDVYKAFWDRDPDGIKTLVLSIVWKFSLEYPPLAQKSLVIEKCTLVLKSGLGDKLGGPFDFGNNAIAEYVVSIMSVTNNPNDVPYIFGLIECLISVNFKELNPESVQHLINHTFTQRLSFLRTDPDMIKSAISVFSKIIECKPSLIIHSSIFSSTIVGFAAEGLIANELFIIQAILKFWTSFLNMKKGTQDDQAEASRLLLQENVGQAVSDNLISSFLKAPRSNLDYFYSIFRGLVAKYPVPYKAWLVTSLGRLAGLLDKFSEKDIELFVHKLLVTRGRRTANEILKQFWLAANGLVEYNHLSY